MVEKKSSELAFRLFLHVFVGPTLEGHSVALPMVEHHVGPDLQGFYKVSPTVKLVLAYLFSVPLKKIYTVFHLLKKSILRCPPMSLLCNCVLQLGQMTVFIFVTLAAVDFGHSQVT